MDILTLTVAVAIPLALLILKYSSCSSQRYTSITWKEKRALVLARDRHRCTSCGTYQNLIVCHKHSAEVLPSTPIASLQALCRKCKALSTKGSL